MAKQTKQTAAAVEVSIPAAVEKAAVALGKAAGGAKGAAVALGKSIREACKGIDARKAMLAAAWVKVVEAAGKSVSADSLSVYKSLARAAAGIPSRGGGRPAGKGKGKGKGGTGGTGGEDADGEDADGEDAGGERITAATTQVARFALVLRVMEACGVESLADALFLVREAYRDKSMKRARRPAHPAAS